MSEHPALEYARLLTGRDKSSATADRLYELWRQVPGEPVEKNLLVLAAIHGLEDGHGD